jgi:integrase
MGRKGKYLFQRPGSQNWWVRFQYNGHMRSVKGTKKIEFSLGTTDFEQAQLLAMPHIFEHKASLLLIRSNQQKAFFQGFGGRLYEPGLHTDPDGVKIYATDKQIIYLDDQGKPTERVKDNLSCKVHFSSSAAEYRDVMQYLPEQNLQKHSQFLDEWVRQRNINEHIEREARSAWDICLSITKGRSLKNCSREDGKALVSRLQELGNSPATIAKKVGHLRAAANIAVDERKLEYNPFVRVTPKNNKRLSGRFLDTNDMQIVRENLHKLSENDQLLWKMLAFTGMRLSEPFHIQEEFEEEGVRYVEVGTKTDASYRRVPIPTKLHSYLPARITAPVFEGEPEVAGKRLRYFLRKLGISYDKSTGSGNKKKVVHSLRHRAKDKLRYLGCPADIQGEILGHEKRTRSVSYGLGYPVPVLLKWIDKIGY